MWFVGIGLLALVLKLLGPAFMAGVPWWVVALPFGMAVVWWYVADQTGYTQRRAMEAEAQRAHEQRERRYEALGMRVMPLKGGKKSESKGGRLGDPKGESVQKAQTLQVPPPL